jgi:hypothetical protein
MCMKRFALWGRDTHVSALSRSCLRRSLRVMGARPLCPAPVMVRGNRCALCAGHTMCGTQTVGGTQTVTCRTYARMMCEEHFALGGRDTRVYALSHSSVREALRAMGCRAGHARVRPLPHLCAESADRCVGEIASVCPVPQLRAGSAFVLHGRHRASLAEPRAFPPSPAPMCGKRCAMCSPLVHAGWVGGHSKRSPRAVTCPATRRL